MAVWQRDMTAPPAEPYKGIQFRSHLELAVAKELDGFGVDWIYEACPACDQPVRPITTPAGPCGCGGGPVRYLPDFRIVSARPDLHLPRWLEVKPAELLYAARDAANLSEDLGGEEMFVFSSATQWSVSGVAEIHKPLKLAEHSVRHEVLIVSSVNRTRTLSLSCKIGGVTFSKWHPFVNWKGHVRRVEQEANRVRWEAERVEREREWERQEAERKAHRAEGVAYVNRLARIDPGAPARYDGLCYVCARHHEAAHLTIWNVQGRWISMCDACRTLARAGRS